MSPFMSASCRLLPTAVAPGPWNMAADDVLLASAAAGVASLRFYGWWEPTLRTPGWPDIAQAMAGSISTRPTIWFPAWTT